MPDSAGLNAQFQFSISVAVMLDALRLFPDFHSCSCHSGLRPRFLCIVSFVHLMRCHLADIWQSRDLNTPDFLVYVAMVSKCWGSYARRSWSSPICRVYCHGECDAVSLLRHSPQFWGTAYSLGISAEKNPLGRRQSSLQRDRGQNTRAVRGVTRDAMHRLHVPMTSTDHCHGNWLSLWPATADT
jgi:hypothetical protein